MNDSHPILQTQLATLAQSLGLPELARQLGMSPQTLARLIAGLPVRRGTIVLAERALSSLPAIRA